MKIESGDKSPGTAVTRLGIKRLKIHQNLLALGATLSISLPFALAYFGHGRAISPFYPLFGVMAAVLIQVLNSNNQRIGQAEDLAMKASLELLEEGFSLLEDGVETGTRNRLNWLTAARNIITSASMIDEISDKTRRAIALEKEFLFRMKYRALLWPPGDLDGPLAAEFFADSARDYKYFIRDVDTRDPIAISSIVEVFRFTLWPSERKDPLDQDKRFTKKEIESMLFWGPRGLGELMRQTTFPNDTDLMYHEEV